MGSPTIKFIRSPSVSISNGSKLLTVTGSIDTYHVYSGTVLFVGSNPPREAVSGTTVDNSGNSTITLAEPWDLPSVSGQPLVAFNSNEGLPEAIRSARSIGDLALSLLNGFEQLLSGTTSSVTLEINGIPTSFVPYQYLVNQFQSKQNEIDSLTGSSNATTKAEFFALAEQRKSQSAGSGFAEMGQHINNSSFDSINEGLWTASSANAGEYLYFGLGGGTGSKSRTDAAFALINGTSLKLGAINTPPKEEARIAFPPAPDGKKTYDSSTGTVTQHASAAIAFAAETATNKVITSRQDFVFIESWHEKISDKGVVYPLGNVQYGGTTYEGITLAVNGIAQGYSAFGEWDSTTTGNCAVWANLTDTQKAIFIQDHKNNIYSDNGELIQVRYRVRVVESVSDVWSKVGIHPSNQGLLFVSEQADSALPEDLTTTNHWSVPIGDSGYLDGSKSKIIPIALVQR